MKSWKDVPNLFANGKFLCALPHFINLRIEMYDTLANMYCLSDVKGWHKISDCTLIARKIEDMTDDELKIHREKQICIPDMEGVYRFRETPESFLYALSVGCLPEMFEWDETVIDSKTL